MIKRTEFIATFDIGTTAVKGVLMSEEGKNIMEESVGLETIFLEDWKEQRPSDWYAAFCKISRGFFEKGISPSDVKGIVMSGQMQDLIPIGADFLPVRNAILYSDGRASAEAQEILKVIGEETIRKSTGNHFDGSMPFAKLLWVKKQEPINYSKIKKVLISSKDYIIAKLTGNFVTDVTAAATSGCMDIRKKQWNTSWLLPFELDWGKLPRLCYAQDEAGRVHGNGSVDSGYLEGTPVYVGTGDAGATTLASGIAKDGEFNINLGTSGWIACVSDTVLERPGVFNLAAMPKDSYINVVPFLNAGNVHKWITGILKEDKPENPYEQINLLLEKSEAGSNGVMFLPYLVGERFPVMDTEIKGAFIGLVPETTKSDLARSTLEGVAYSIRQGMESIGRVPCKISIIGGGAKVSTWCQILADMLNHPVYAYGDSEYLPSAAISSAVLIGQGKIADYKDFTDSLQNSATSQCYYPIPAHVKKYESIYPRYKRLYPAIQTLAE